ncbi:hypothetical protein SDC9_120529 [bioreactor metagenome]|uniref:Uncharacterized protein n=1 Tax=bioreactor metagenome TaxID=1076179 RepID=A0A645C853_9ZZZZ
MHYIEVGVYPFYDFVVVLQVAGYVGAKAVVPFGDLHGVGNLGVAKVGSYEQGLFVHEGEASCKVCADKGLSLFGHGGGHEYDVVAAFGGHEEQVIAHGAEHFSYEGVVVVFDYHCVFGG